MAYLQLAQCKNIYSKDGLHQLTPSTINDFHALGYRRPVDKPTTFFRNHGRDFNVCCADFEKGVLVLVRPKEGIRMKAFSFFGEALRRHAEEVLVIPFDQLAAVAAEVADDVAHITTVFLYHTARCGSTLLVRALEASGLVHGVSEPDIHMSILQYRQSQPCLQEEDLKMLTDVMGYSTTLFNFTLFQQDPTRTAVCCKTRGEGIRIADLLQMAVPEAKTVLLYRDCVGNVDSTLRVLVGSYWKYWLLTALRLDSKILPGYLMADMTRDPQLASVPVRKGVVWAVTCLWLGRMQKTHELTKKENSHFFNAVLRYEELCKYREKIVLKVLEDLGIVCEDKNVKDKIKAVFGVNSQAGHTLAGRWGTASDSWVGDWEKGVISTILTHANMDVSRPDFVLTGTITEI